MPPVALAVTVPVPLEQSGFVPIIVEEMGKGAGVIVKGGSVNLQVPAASFSVAVQVPAGKAGIFKAGIFTDVPVKRMGASGIVEPCSVSINDKFCPPV